MATLNPPPTASELDAIFSNIEEIYEVTVTLLGSLEDTLETVAEEAANGGNQSTQPGGTASSSTVSSPTSGSPSSGLSGSNTGSGIPPTPAVGCCFEELAEGAEFDVYDRYAKDVLSAHCRDALQAVLSRPDVGHALATGGHGFREAVRYYLPKLLVTPVYHCFTYFDAIRVLHRLSPSKEDRESLEQVEGLLKPLQVELERLLQSYSPSSFVLPKRKPSEAGGLMGPLIRTGLLGGPRSSRPAALCKLQELQRSIEGWGDGGSGGSGGGGSSGGSGGGGGGGSKEAGPACNEFICEGLIGKVGAGKRPTERYAFLFDGLLLLCKPNSSGHHHHGHHRRSSAASGKDNKDCPPEYRLKEKYFIRKVEILDREDTEELRNAFEVAPRQSPHCVLFARTPEEKANWMAALVMLNTKSMLERTLDVILLDEERKHPLRLPPPSLYRFAEEDSESNLVLETRENGGVPLIKGIQLYTFFFFLYIFITY